MVFAERCVGARQRLKECTGYKCCGVFPSLPPLEHTSEILCPLPNLFQCTKAMLLLHPCLVIPILGVFWHRLLILLFPLPASPSWRLGPTWHHRCRCEATGFPGAEAWPRGLRKVDRNLVCSVFKRVWVIFDLSRACFRAFTFYIAHLFWYLSFSFFPQKNCSNQGFLETHG